MNTFEKEDGACHGCELFQGTPGTGTPHPGTENRMTWSLLSPLFQVFQGISILDNTETNICVGGLSSSICFTGEYNANTLEHLEHPLRRCRSVAVFCSRVPWNTTEHAPQFEVMT